MNKIPRPLIIKAEKTLRTIVKYRFILGFLAMSLAIIFVLQINNSYAQVDKNENAITDGLSAVRRVKFNQEAIDKIKSLTDQNTKVDPNLPKNRTNPF